MDDYTLNSTGAQVDAAAQQVAATADYVVEQGISGIWTYRKWNSGIAECWSISADSSAEAFAATGNVYYRAHTISLPTLFLSAPMALATVRSGNVMSCSASANDASTVSITVMSAAAEARVVTYQVVAYGRWK